MLLQPGQRVGTRIAPSVRDSDIATITSVLMLGRYHGLAQHDHRVGTGAKLTMSILVNLGRLPARTGAITNREITNPRLRI
jgi:hypothetical protein